MFYVDGLPQLEVNTSLYEWNSFTFDVNPGSHIFQWKFLNGIRYSTSLLTLQTVSVYSIPLYFPFLSCSRYEKFTLYVDIYKTSSFKDSTTMRTHASLARMAPTRRQTLLSLDALSAPPTHTTPPKPASAPNVLQASSVCPALPTARTKYDHCHISLFTS